MKKILLLDAASRNILLDWVLPATGILCFILCIILLFSKRNDLKGITESVNVKWINLKVSTIILALTIISIVFIAPTIFFYYKGFENLESDKKMLNEQLQNMQGQISNNRELIKQIQKCMMPISFSFPNMKVDSLPSLDDLRCSVTYQGDVRIAFPMKTGFDAYKVLVNDINCDNLITRMEVEDQKTHRVWVADQVEPCKYFSTPLLLNEQK